MKVVVCSDSHGDTRTLKKIEMIEQADVYLFLGDSEVSPDDIKPFISVKGNCDYFEYPLTRILHLENEHIFMAHGHTQLLSSLIEVCKAHKCNILIYGHTHKYQEKYIDSVYVLNPGSISRPRDGMYPTYMVLEIDDKGVKTIKREVRF